MQFRPELEFAEIRNKNPAGISEFFEARNQGGWGEVASKRIRPKGVGGGGK